MSDMAVKGGGRSEYEEERKVREEREPPRKANQKDKSTIKLETEQKKSTHKKSKTDEKEKCKGSDVKSKSSKGSDISGRVESKGERKNLKNEEADGKQKKEYAKVKKVYNKSECKEDMSGDEFGKEIGMCKEFEKGCDVFSLYLDNYKEEVVRWQEDWRGVKVMETYDEWGARNNREKVEAKRERREVEKSSVRVEEEQEPPVKRNRSSGTLDIFRPGPAPGTPRMWCSECDKYLAGGPSHLQRHKDTVHLGLQPWECTGCDSKFGCKSDLEAHISQVHLGQRFYSCTVEGCGKSFQRNTILKDHGRAEHNLPRLCCPDCGATYAWSSDFNDHKKKHRLGLLLGLN